MDEIAISLLKIDEDLTNKFGLPLGAVLFFVVVIVFVIPIYKIVSGVFGV